MNLTMKVSFLQSRKIFLLVFLIIISLHNTMAQENNFWSNVRFGGNLGIGFSDDTFNAVAAPAAIYSFNDQFSAGLGLIFGYSTFENDRLNEERTSTNYGASVITLFNPFEGLQLSAEFEQMGVSRSIEINNEKFDDDYWYPALFLGGAYRVGFVSLGIKYDVLYDDDKSIYGSAYVPFVRVFF